MPSKMLAKYEQKNYDYIYDLLTFKYHFIHNSETTFITLLNIFLSTTHHFLLFALIFIFEHSVFFNLMQLDDNNIGTYQQ